MARPYSRYTPNSMNTFGNTGVQFPLYDPRGVKDNRRHFRRGALGGLEFANSFCCPAGRRSSRGWVLVARGDYEQLDTYATNHVLHLGDTASQDNVGPLGNLSIVRAQCVTRGLASDRNSLYLVELTDARGVLMNEWVQYPLTAAYNIRSPAYPETFQLASMRDYPAAGPGSKTTWTWATMLQDMWERMAVGGDLLGPWPGLPSAPAGTPEGFWFTGMPAWVAMCDVLDHLGMVVACDLTRADPFTIVSDGADDPAFTALQTMYTTNLEDDLEWVDTGSGRAPKVVRVMFRRRNAVYGTEESVTYRNDAMAQQWDMIPLYSVDVGAPAIFSAAVGTHHLWSDFTVRYDQDSNPLAEDIAVAGAIARERVSQYFDRIYSRTSGSMSQTYAGALPFATGSQVGVVRWYQDHRGDGGWAGWRTEVARGSDQGN